MLHGLTHRLWPALRTTYENWTKDGGWLLSAAMAYYVAFSLFPLLLVLLSLLGIVARYSPLVQDSQQDLLTAVAQNADPWLADQLRAMLSSVKDKAGVGGPIGLVTLILAAMGIFAQLDSIFDRIWNVPPPKKTGILASIKRTLYDRGAAFLMLLGAGGMVVLIMLVDFALSAVRTYAVELPAGQWAWEFVQRLVTLTLNTLLFAALYKFLPKAPVRWREALAGGLLVALIWELGKLAFSRFIIGEKYSAYGVVGSFIGVMLWVYYASAAIFLGAEFVQTLCRQCRATPEAAAKQSPSHAR
jgi:membrane protein